MKRSRKRQISEDPIEILLDLSERYWQVGALMASFLATVSLSLFNWVVTQNKVQYYESVIHETLMNRLGSLLYLFPLIFLVLAAKVAVKAINTYRRTNLLIEH